jgi:hypothetical protein
MTFHLPVALLVALVSQAQPAAPECTSWQVCRDEALQAAELQDFERFHDLAWRAMQKGPRNQPELMQLLARAQSLSGRPTDALVMLERLAALGVKTEAATSDDFRRVRALPGWAAFEERLAALPAPAAAPPPPVVPTPPASAAPAPATRTNDAAGVPREVRSRTAVPEAAPTAATVVNSDAADALRFTTLSFTPAGLAYDYVSNRFIVGDQDANKLTVVDEGSQRVANLAGAQSAGFGDIAGLEIDAREGDLWVVSSSSAGEKTQGGADRPAATLHKLQLISGRVLYAVDLEPDLGPARFADIAVTRRSSILVLDNIGQRVFVVPPRAKRLQLAVQLDASPSSSLAPGPGEIVYVARADGIVRVDLQSRRARPVTAPAGTSLAGITRLRWHNAALLAIQPSGDGTYSVVRFKMDGAGLRITKADVLDRNLRMPDPTAAALSGDFFYYLATPAGVDGAARTETIIRRVTVK